MIQAELVTLSFYRESKISEEELERASATCLEIWLRAARLDQG